MSKDIASIRKKEIGEGVIRRRRRLASAKVMIVGKKTAVLFSSYSAVQYWKAKKRGPGLAERIEHACQAEQQRYHHKPQFGRVQNYSR